MEILPYQRNRLLTLTIQPTVLLDRPSIFSITGSGAGACLQGILSGDVLRPGPGALGYAGALSPKGMILFDVWWLRSGGQFIILADREVHDRLRDHLGRQLPPRLAKLADLTETHAAIFVLGPNETTVIDGLPSELGAVRELPSGIIIGRGTAQSPFAALAVGPTAILENEVLPAALERAAGGTAVDLRAARILAGVPTLGSDIDERTLPQEVRFDELEGVSYNKGCFVGQETVARLHFRGHPNWILRAVTVTPGSSLPEDGVLAADGKPQLRLGSLLQLDGGELLGLAKVRREVEVGTRFQVPGGLVEVSDLPVQLDDPQ